MSVTFDDGYAENCDFAIPLLVREKIPCTYFVASRHVLEGLPFPHDLTLGQRIPPNTLEELGERWPTTESKSAAIRERI